MLSFDSAYTRDVLKKKLELVCTKISGIGNKFVPAESQSRFATDYESLRECRDGLLADGASPESINIVRIAKRLNVRQEFWFYLNCTKGICPTSVDAERLFSILTRMRTYPNPQFTPDSPSSRGSASTGQDDGFHGLYILGWR